MSRRPVICAKLTPSGPCVRAQGHDTPCCDRTGTEWRDQGTTWTPAPKRLTDADLAIVRLGKEAALAGDRDSFVAGFRLALELCGPLSQSEIDRLANAARGA